MGVAERLCQESKALSQIEVLSIKRLDDARLKLLPLAVKLRDMDYYAVRKGQSVGGRRLWARQI